LLPAAIANGILRHLFSKSKNKEGDARQLYRDRQNHNGFALGKK
jgi:hypothetical protein